MRKLFLIGGISGAGKSVALRQFEDCGFYCTDNLPIVMLSQYLDSIKKFSFVGVAVGVDVRGLVDEYQLSYIFEQLNSRDFSVRVIFLEAENKVLVGRYSETRRRHPLANHHLTIEQCIELERRMLSPIRDISYVIDTSELQPKQLQTQIDKLVEIQNSKLLLILQSFGFKHNIPLDADYIFDVRCLPNPFYDEKLRKLNGRDREVIEYLESYPIVTKMKRDIIAFIENYLPEFEKGKRASVNISIGCTGGQHRSVYLVESLAKHFANFKPIIRHLEKFYL